MANYYDFKYFNEEWNGKEVEKNKADETGVARRSSSTDPSEEQKKVQP